MKYTVEKKNIYYCYIGKIYFNVFSNMRVMVLKAKHGKNRTKSIFVDFDIFPKNYET